jgi:glycerophosphoryl diester phosphodiesterase
VPENHGHRGARALRPENTLPGLAYALGAGVDAVEFDVTFTRDGGLILAHDLTVDDQVIRDTGPAADGDPLYPYAGKRWLDLTLAQVATLDAGDRQPRAPYEETFVPVPGTRVPTFGQVCELFARDREARVVLSAELKTSPEWADSDVRRLVRAVLETVRVHDLTGRCRVLGFDWRVLKEAAACEPDVPRVALVEPRTWAPGSPWLAGLDAAGYGTDVIGCAAAARDVGAAWVSPWDGMVSPGLIVAAHEAGLGVIVWTVNDPARMTELIKLGADAIVTDRPDVLRDVLAGGLSCSGEAGQESMATERKSLLLRLDPAVHDALARWASDELRSTNAQIEFLLRKALTDAGRMPRRAAPQRGPGRPPKDGAETG